MFLPDWPTRRRGRTMIVSASLHLVLLTSLVIGPMWAIQEPPELPVKFCCFGPIPLPVQLVKTQEPTRKGEPVKVASTEPRVERRSPKVTAPRVIPDAPPRILDQPPVDEIPVFQGPEEEGPRVAENLGPKDGDVGGRGSQAEPPVLIPGTVPNLSAPIAVSTPDPLYPDAARHARLEGVVVLQSVIGPDGRVQDVRVVMSANPLLDRAAVEAVKRWIYRPAHIDGRNVSVYLTVTLTFRLRG